MTPMDRAIEIAQTEARRFRDVYDRDAARGAEEVAGALIVAKLDAARARPWRLVILESPYAGDIEKNVTFARAAMRDCLARGDAPAASHLLYTQPGVLDDGDREQRARGIDAGLAWGRVAEATVVYIDLGISEGMREGIRRAHLEGRPVEYRELACPFCGADFTSQCGGCRALDVQPEGEQSC